MMPLRLRSLQLRLAVQLAILYAVAMAIGAAILIYQAYDTAETLGERDLGLRAADLARHAVPGPNGARLDLPAQLAAAYQAGDADMFALRASDGRVLAASPPGFGEAVAKWPLPSDEPSYFNLRGFGPTAQDYHGLSVSLESAAGPVAIAVARAKGADALASALLREFIMDVAWIVPLLVAVTVGVGILVIRRGLKPVREISQMAARIGPATTHIRLSQKDLPAEIEPLVAAVNRALERLEQGFAVQRKFTGNAAHELRTPLAIVTAMLDAMEGNGELGKLRADVARMNRIVEQLLRVARLDAIALDVSATVDLKDVASEVVATLAPWALAQDRMIAFAGPDRPVPIKGNKHAIGDAIRNLVENAVVHSPPRSEVAVSVEQAGRVSVLDHGPGIAAEQREMIFERFWRGKGTASNGAGLGLAIVREIMNAHRGSIRVDQGAAGGASFTLCFAHTKAVEPVAPLTSASP
jgi:two-component system, OmpR family, sensor histidine kinase TctE